ncbi:unannotated protein [freshwater metagenome]|uniref:Unannotated protein n=1 Tax=freshwater metagenome TaxID=449393 RepID=A0A6J6PWF4_9ZZZZ
MAGSDTFFGSGGFPPFGALSSAGITLPFETEFETEFEPGV